jgi:hypothetical protein
MTSYPSACFFNCAGCNMYATSVLRFKIDGVSPGVYDISASHPLWKVSQVCVVTIPPLFPLA